MKVVYVSNTCEHVVRPLCDGLYSEYGDDFVFIQTQKLDSARAGIGCLEERNYVLNSDSDEAKAKKLCEDADVVIYGAAPIEYIQERIKSNKPTIYYSERLFKKGYWRYFIPKTRKTVKNKYVIPSQNSNFYMLCASSFAAIDFVRIKAFENRMYKWGYQVKINEKNIDELIEQKSKDGLDFIWVGRLIKLKHCDHAIRVVKRLKDEGYEPRMKIIGSGEEEGNLKALVEKLGVSSNVIFKGTCKIDETRAEMDKANVFMFTSDFGEGWGATLNECMNSACACVASHAAGSTNFLINDEKNGLVYRSGDVDSLYKKVKSLVDDTSRRESIAKNAYTTMYELWNPEKSYKRMVELINAVIEGKNFDLYSEGPCSRALKVKENWYKKR